MNYTLRFFAFALFAISSLNAQQRTPGIGPSNPGIGTTSPGTTPGMPPGSIGPGTSVPTQPNQNGIPGEFPNSSQTPIFLTGRVVMEDGAPPPASISIQRECSSLPRTVAYTNSKGQFSFQWDNFAGIMPDASEPGIGARSLPGLNAPRGGGLGDPTASTRTMFGCDLIASAAGFRSDRIDLSTHRATDNPDLGAIVLHRIAGVEGTSVSATSLSAPKDARKAWEKGVQLLHKSKPADAEKELEKAVDIYPKYANAWLDLGRARLQQQSEVPAREAFQKAIDADGKLVDPYLELGELSARQKAWPDAARYLDRALDLDPVDYPRLWFEDAVADYNVQNFDRAEKNVREATRLPKSQLDPHSELLLGLILITKHDYAGASQALHAYLNLAPDAPDQDQVKAQLDQIDSQRSTAKP